MRESPEDDVDAVARLARAELRRRGKSDAEIEAELAEAEERRAAAEETLSFEDVATGYRRGAAHYEPDADQLVRLQATTRPADPLPPQQSSAAVEHGDVARDRPPIEDVRIDTDERSVWDARPPSEDETGREP